MTDVWPPEEHVGFGVTPGRDPVVRVWCWQSPSEASRTSDLSWLHLTACAAEGGQTWLETESNEVSPDAHGEAFALCKRSISNALVALLGGYHKTEDPN